MRTSDVLSIIMLAATPFALGAQACNKGPGSAFGVTGYTCTQCQVEWKTADDQTYTFSSAPTVISTTESSELKRGDVIEAVDGRPITTRQGAEIFVKPSNGEHSVTVRRNGSRTDIKTRAMSCGSDQQTTARDISWQRATSIIAGQQILQVKPTPSESQSRFGFAVACIPSCTKVRSSSDPGVAYWKYDDYPLIAAVRKDGPAERAGLRNGDVVTKVDGISVLEEKGALKLFQSEGATTLNITVSREGKEVAFLMRSN
jgi:C-terminal processing protease CtpA/Prc